MALNVQRCHEGFQPCHHTPPSSEMNFWYFLTLTTCVQAVKLIRPVAFNAPIEELMAVMDETEQAIKDGTWDP